VSELTLVAVFALAVFAVLSTHLGLVATVVYRLGLFIISIRTSCINGARNSEISSTVFGSMIIKLVTISRLLSTIVRNHNR